MASVLDYFIYPSVDSCVLTFACYKFVRDLQNPLKCLKNYSMPKISQI